MREKRDGRLVRRDAPATPRAAKPKPEAKAPAAHSQKPQPAADAAKEAPAAKRPARKKPHWILRILLFFVKLGFAMVCLAVIAVSVLAVAVSSYLAEATVNDEMLLDLDNLRLSYSSAIYVRDSATGEYYEYLRLVGEENREWIDLRNIPETVQNAFIAAEDQNFRTHHGVSIRRNIFAVLNEVSYRFTGNYLGNGVRQGASTIDQQLIKNLLGDDDVEGTEGYKRKIREIFRAYMLERRYSKDMILEAYLNVVGLTGNTAGVEAGSQAYFGKSVRDLTLVEAASLACITNNPTKYNPWNHPQEHVERRNYVLWCMWDQGYISEAAYRAASAAPLELYDRDSAPVQDQTTEEGDATGNKVVEVLDEETGEVVEKVVPYTCNYNWFVDKLLDDVTHDLMEQLDLDRSEANYLLFNGGLSIYATMVPEVQTAMEEVMANAEMFPQVPYALKDDEGNPVLDENGEQVTILPQAGMACVNYQGELVGIVGGLGTKTEDRAFSRAADAARPIGSTMKPIGVYGLGIEDDYITYSSLIPDLPIQVPASKVDASAPDPNAPRDWPRNYAGTPSGRNVTVAYALAQSLNTVAVRVGEMVRPENSYEFLTNTLQISTLVYPNDVDNGPMALGSVSIGISPYELAGAYSIFGSGGRFTTLHSYVSVEDRAGDIVIEPVITTVQALSEETAMIVNRMMYGVLHGGTGNGLYVRGDMESVGKTGTTSDDKDHWFVGLTPYYCTATWWGYDDQVTLDWHNYGQHPPTLAWRAVMEKVQEGLEYRAFPSSDGVVVLNYCTESGALAGPNCPSTAKGYYKADGRQPEETCPIHGG